MDDATRAERAVEGPALTDLVDRLGSSRWLREEAEVAAWILNDMANQYRRHARQIRRNKQLANCTDEEKDRVVDAYMDRLGSVLGHLKPFLDRGSPASRRIRREAARVPKRHPGGCLVLLSYGVVEYDMDHFRPASSPCDKCSEWTRRSVAIVARNDAIEAQIKSLRELAERRVVDLEGGTREP